MSHRVSSGCSQHLNSPSRATGGDSKNVTPVQCVLQLILCSYDVFKGNIFILTVQYLEKYSSAVQQLASRGWHRVNRQEELLTGGGRGGGRW